MKEGPRVLQVAAKRNRLIGVALLILGGYFGLSSIFAWQMNPLRLEKLRQTRLDALEASRRMYSGEGYIDVGSHEADRPTVGELTKDPAIVWAEDTMLKLERFATAYSPVEIFGLAGMAATCFACAVFFFARARRYNRAPQRDLPRRERVG